MKKLKIACIVAADLCNYIGKDNDLPWLRIPEDMKYFRKLTTGNIVIMGRKTFESMGSKPLPNRTNIVITSKNVIRLKERNTKQHIWFVNSIEHALHMANNISSTAEKIFIIGGASLYNHFWDKADEIYLTRICRSFEGCDTKIKPIDLNLYGITEYSTIQSSQHRIDFLKYTKYSTPVDMFFRKTIDKLRRFLDIDMGKYTY